MFLLWNSKVQHFLQVRKRLSPPTAGLFEKSFPLWEADKQYVKNDLFTYNGSAGYVKQPSLTSQEIYPPFSVGTEALYGARPKPDADGIYPYVYNMGIYKGMLVRDDDGVLYRSITGTQEQPTELLYHPKDVPALLEKWKKTLQKNQRVQILTNHNQKMTIQNGFSQPERMMLMHRAQR